MENEYYPFVNLPLPYAYDALEPYIDEKTMHLHHDKHLQTYIDNLNKVLDAHPELQSLSLTELLKYLSRMPADVQQPIRNNGGGVYNHRFYFALLTNPSEGEAVGHLGEAITRTFGSFQNFKDQFKQAALSVFGSGYAWLVLNNGRLEIMTTANQNTSIELRLGPILAIDVWEHAYYLKHYNVRADYIDDWFKVVNWEQAELNYYAAMNM